MKTLIEYSNLIKENLHNPGVLSEIGVEAAADYAYYAAILKPIKEKKAQEWINLKYSGDTEKLLSDRLVEMKWRITEDGKKEYAVELKMKALDKLTSSIKNSSFISRNEIRNEI